MTSSTDTPQPRFAVDPQGDHEYLVRDTEGPADAEGWRVRVSPEVLDDAGAGGADEERAVRDTLGWLLERQPIGDLPLYIDLDDVAAGYPDFVADLGRRLNAS